AANGIAITSAKPERLKLAMTLRKPGRTGVALLDKPVSISLCARAIRNLASHDLWHQSEKRLNCA
ncbi:MAG: hypothetical protein U0975_10490, partial [Erythrobacter sp.]|nr:hypothetical protein [Erythrobacter sp.]